MDLYQAIKQVLFEKFMYSNTERFKNKKNHLVLSWGIPKC